MNQKIVIVTGATSGIGHASALAFAKAGATVIAAGRRQAEGDQLIAEIKAEGGEGIFIQTDVTHEAEVKALIDQTMSKYGRLDVAFNNAGVEVTGMLSEATEKDYRHVFDTNVWSVITSMKYEIPAMLKSGGGSIINTSSIAGHIGMAGAGLYIASKHAVEGLTKTAALELATQGIRVNAVAPGAIETDMVTRFTGGGKEENVAYLRSLHPIGRLGHVREIADPVLFLASDAASFITGTSLVVDGGFTAR